ncbi:hypothetical protein HG263_19335 [Pseudoalteromonas sp. JBTF-M23]|uniref:Uncharacterized protein n=1 Tax=Pseudoalteromonas caenipelagi TaxID=2726988 RepID=A0A849VGX5_9GAMM|nr:hypothetical protein [Pseudoalteromonas caenipelagi]NOU52662.1 hypothetical protein [Pseudoalteromonas caenipelagi]
MKLKTISLCGLFASFNSLAGALICTGTVDELAFHSNDRFMVKLSSMNAPVFFCNSEKAWTVDGAPDITSPETCKMLYSSFLAAKAAKTHIPRLHIEGVQVPSDCNRFAPWSGVSIRYVKFE